jgi:replicative superfamily II helicase
MKYNILLVFSIVISTSGTVSAQGLFKRDKKDDTSYSVMLDTVVITERSLKNYNYNRYKYIVNKVYPIADTAIYLLHELEKAEADMKKRDAKKYKKELEESLREKFEDRLKNMSRTEGTVLIEIIERNTGRTMYDILKDIKSGSTAFWWQNLGRFYGYNLKDGYQPENNPMLEPIIVEYETSHQKKKSD